MKLDRLLLVAFFALTGVAGVTNAANEIGYLNGAGGATTVTMFGGDSASPVALTAIHTGATGETITLVKVRIATGAGTTLAIGLFGVNGSDQPTGAPIYTPITVNSTTSGLKTQAVSWALTNGVRYVLAIGENSGIIVISSDSQANGSSFDSSTGSLSSFTHISYKTDIVEVAGDITTSSSNLLMKRRRH
jgi:hypothetical protein